MFEKQEKLLSPLIFICVFRPLPLFPTDTQACTRSHTRAHTSTHTTRYMRQNLPTGKTGKSSHSLHSFVVSAHCCIK